MTRPNYVKVRAMDLDMQPFELEATELLARAVCHECDHLDGIMYTQHVEGPLRDVAYQEKKRKNESHIYGNAGFFRGSAEGLWRKRI